MRTAFASFALLVVLNTTAIAQTTQNNCPHPARSTPPSAVVLAARQTERQVCAADTAKFCGNVPRGCGRPMQCLRAHQGELSAACVNAIAQLHAAHTQSHNAPPSP
jgi:hypothetical protein